MSGDQDRMHQALADAVPLDAGQMLTGWVLVYEAVGVGNEAYAGHFYGPETMTTWRAMGLIEWARSRTLPETGDGE